MATAHIAFGGNLGDPTATWGHALERIVAHPGCQVRKVSRLYRTAAMGDHAGSEYLNAAAAIETKLEPHPFLALLQGVEQELGRTRLKPWGPRPIDLDLILFGECVIESDELVLPHPSAWHRRFVLDPLSEIAANAIHPVKNVAISELRKRLLPRPLSVAVAGGEAGFRQRCVAILRTEFAGIAISEWNRQDPEPAILFWLGDSANHAQSFRSLPLVSRLDLAAAQQRDGSSDAMSAMRYVLQSALDEPTPADP